MDPLNSSPNTPPNQPSNPDIAPIPTSTENSSTARVNPELAEILQPTTAFNDTEVQENPGALLTVANAFKSIFMALLSWVIFPIIVVLILHNFVFQAYHVLGTSMVSTLHETDYLIVSKLGDTTATVQSLFGKKMDYIPGRGQIIVFHYPQDPSKVFVKRVVGLPGDHVVIQGGKVTIFNAARPQGFNPDTLYELADTVTQIDTDETIQPGNVFVLGDNRTPGGSFDSREWGQLPSSYIIGDAVMRLLPLKDTKIF